MVKIGCQYSSKPRKGWKSFKKLRSLLGDEYEYVAFGSEKYSKPWLTYIQNPSFEELKKLYRSCDIFFAPNKLEGFYNCAAEAALCGCLIVCSSHYSNGMGDYAYPETAVVFDSVGEAAEKIKEIDFSDPLGGWCIKIMKMKSRLLEIGNRSKNMKHLVEVLCSQNKSMPK